MNRVLLLLIIPPHSWSYQDNRNDHSPLS